MAKTSAFDTHRDEYDNWFDAHADLYVSEPAAIRVLLPEDHLSP